jgi:hopanoid biosynthesis associated RND transporter like protein HpnN
VLLALVAAGYAGMFLQISSDQDKLVAPNLPFQRQYLDYVKNFGDQENIYVIIETGGNDKGKAAAAKFANRLAERLAKYPSQLKSVHYRITPSDLGDSALLYAPTEALNKLTASISGFAPQLQSWRNDGSLSGLLELTTNLLEGNASSSKQGMSDPAFAGAALEGLGQLLGNLDSALKGKEEYHPMLDLAHAQAEYFFTGPLLLMQIFPIKDYSTMDVIGKPLATIKTALAATRTEFPGIQVGITGRPVLQADEMNTTDQDMRKASIISTLGVLLLFIYFLGGWLRPLLTVISLVIAIAWTYGFATLSVGELNLLSIVFALILIGDGVDFGVHVVTRYNEARENGENVKDAVHTAMMFCTPNVLIGGLTSAAAFFAVSGFNFVGLAQLGLIAGAGILLCVIAMLTVLPALFLTVDARQKRVDNPKRAIRLRFLEPLLAHPKRVLTILGLLTLAATPGLLHVFKTPFNYNLLELQSKDLESVKYEQRLIEASDTSTWYAAFLTRDLTQVKRLTQQLKSVPSVGEVKSILTVLPSAQEEKRELLTKTAKTLGASAVTTTPAAPDPEKLTASLQHLVRALENLEEKLFSAGANTELEQLGKTLESARSALSQLDSPNATTQSRLEHVQTLVHADITSGLTQLQRWLAPKLITPSDLPPAIKQNFIGLDGQYQIMASPAGNVWDWPTMERFISDLRKIDPTVTGVVVSTYEGALLMRATLLKAILLTLTLVTLMLWFYSRSLSYVALSLLPVTIGLLWLLELMGWLGISFNLANFFAIPILISISVQGGVNLIARWHILGSDSLFQTSTPSAVMLSFSTIMLGFGGLLLAHHRGLASLGAIMVLGTFTILLATLLVLPTALQLLKNSNNKETQ